MQNENTLATTSFKYVAKLLLLLSGSRWLLATRNAALQLSQTPAIVCTII
jgi:hypothetical protein